MPGELELAFLCTFVTESVDHLAVDVEYLNAVIVGVGSNAPLRHLH